MREIKSVCVYCASSAKVDQVYFDAIVTMATILVKNDISLVYGGGSAGLMGKLADTVLKNKGSIKGIIPGFMVDVEWAHKEVEDMLVVGDMHERKKKFLENADALVAFPGGCGTLEELMEAITLKRLGLFTKPIIIANINGFYAPLIEMLDKCIAEKFMAEAHRHIWTVIEHPEEIMEALHKAPDWDENAIKFAALR